MWRKVARAMLSTDDSVVEAFQYRRIDKQQGNERLPYDDFLYAVPFRFSYDLKWPMDLIFSDEDMQWWDF